MRLRFSWYWLPLCLCAVFGCTYLSAAEKSKATLDDIEGHLEQMKFMLHAGAFTLGILFGVASWFLVLHAMQESDF